MKLHNTFHYLGVFSRSNRHRRAAGRWSFLVAMVFLGLFALCMTTFQLATAVDAPTAVGSPAANTPGVSTAQTPAPEDVPSTKAASDPVIEVVGVRLAAYGGIVDLRYRVIDPERARGLLGKGTKAHMLHQPSGRKLPVSSGKLGDMRAQTGTPESGRHYFVLFTNVDRIVKSGDKITVEIGNFKAEDITVQ